jgi:hypothetical protein
MMPPGNAILPSGVIFSDGPDAILPFLEEESVAPTRNNSVSFELWLNPGDPLSPKIRTSVRRINGEESPHEIITWAKVLHAHVFPGWGATTGPLQKAILNSLPEGINCNIFVAKLEEHETINHALQATRVNSDPMHPHHMAVLAEPLEGPEHATCGTIHCIISGIIECMMPRNALSRIMRHLQHQCIGPAEMIVR